MKKLLSLLLALVLVFALVPMAASAASWFEYSEIIQVAPEEWVGLKPDGTADKLTAQDIEQFYADYQAWLASQPSSEVHGPKDHKLTQNYNTKYHWMECACGARFGVELHVDPLDTKDDTCTCGYHFSDNADLVTLWVNGCPPIKGFDKNETEYELKAYTYKDVKEIKISTRTFDSCATVELPEDLTLKEGKNTFDVKVTAENKKVTKTYTLTIIKEAK